MTAAALQIFGPKPFADMKSGILIVLFAILFVGCSRPENNTGTSSGPVSSLSQVPAVRLNYRYEADVPPPDPTKDLSKEDRNAAVRAVSELNDLDASLVVHAG